MQLAIGSALTTFGAATLCELLIARTITPRRTCRVLSQREAARMVPIFAQPIILAYGTCLSKNFQPFGRRVAKRALRQKSNQRRLLRLTPL